MSPAAARAAAVSAASRAPAPARTRATRPAAELHVVPPVVRHPPLAPFLIMAVVLAVAGLVGLLLLNTLVAQDSFRVEELQKEIKILAEREQRSVERLAAADAPGRLAKKAKALGMVSCGPPAFLLSDGKVVGDSRCGQAQGGQPAAQVKPAPEPATKQAKQVKQAKPVKPVKKPATSPVAETP